MTQGSLPTGKSRLMETGITEHAARVLAKILPPTGDAATSGFYREYIKDQITLDAITCEDLRILCAFFGCSVDRVVGKIVNAKMGRGIPGTGPEKERL